MVLCVLNGTAIGLLAARHWAAPKINAVLLTCGNIECGCGIQ